MTGISTRISCALQPDSLHPPGGRRLPPATFDPTIVTSSDLAVLANSRAFSGYSQVYAVENKGFWRARVLKTRNLRRNYHSPEQAARAVVLWYKRRYREKWVAALQKRKSQGWDVTKTKDGYRAEAYVGTWVKPLGVFASRGEAKRTAEAYARRFSRGQVYRV